MESIAQLKTERDCYAEQIQEEGRVWKDKTEQLLTQVNYTVVNRETTVDYSFENKNLFLVVVFSILGSNK